MPTRRISRVDLQHVLEHTAGLFEGLRGGRLFITGGTGFFGHWLLETFLHANRELDLGARATVLTRDARAFAERSPALALDSAIDLLEGDVRTFGFPAERHGFVIHAATDSGGGQVGRPAYELAESIVDGTRRTLQFALATGARRMLFTSSGAVYGRNVSGVTRISESYRGGPDPMDVSSSYDEAKRMAEQLCMAYTQGSELACSVARCFAFVGPHLPLDAHYAIGNFLRDAIAGRPIHIKGDGSPLRSYLYGADLAIWLWTMLFRGAAGRAYNVGSEDGVSIGELAHLTAETLGPSGGAPVGVRIDQTPVAGGAVTTYVPSTRRAEEELGLRQYVGLGEAIRRTAQWHGYTAK